MKSFLLMLVVILVFVGETRGAPPKTSSQDFSDFEKELDQTRNDASAAKNEQQQLINQGKQDTQEYRGATQKAEQAMDHMSQLADQHPKDTVVQDDVAKAFLDLKEPRRALGIVNRGIALAPNDPNAYVLRGNAEYQLGDYEKANADARRAMQLDPGNKNAAALFGATAGRSGPSSMLTAAQSKSDGGAPTSARPPAARSGTIPHAPASAADVQFSASNPFAGRQAADRAAAELKLGNYEGAARLATKAIESGRKTAGVYLTRAEANMKREKYSEALADAKAATGIDSNLGSGYFIAAQAMRGLGYAPQDIIADFERAAELDPQLQADAAAAIRRIQGENAESGTGRSSMQATTGNSRLRSTSDMPAIRWMGAHSKSLGGFAIFVLVIGASLIAWRVN